jgi:hypothetical protein
MLEEEVVGVAVAGICYFSVEFDFELVPARLFLMNESRSKAIP